MSSKTIKGVPVISILSLPVFDWLCKTYTWSGASLISAGIILNCVIVILLFDNQKDYIPEKQKNLRRVFKLVLD